MEMSLSCPHYIWRMVLTQGHGCRACVMTQCQVFCKPVKVYGKFVLKTAQIKCHQIIVGWIKVTKYFALPQQCLLVNRINSDLNSLPVLIWTLGRRGRRAEELGTGAQPFTSNPEGFKNDVVYSGGKWKWDILPNNTQSFLPTCTINNLSCWLPITFEQ